MNAPNNTDNVCANCATPHGPGDVFCENCGLDFLSGSLPEPIGGSKPSTVSPEPADSTDPVRLEVTVEVDTDFHRLMAPDDQVRLPEPLPEPVHLQVDGREAFIGRTSESRGVYPDIDVQAATGDPAVSTRHAVLGLDDTGAWKLRDLDSTNGTYLGDPDAQIPAGIAVPVEPGDSIFVGAYTRITIRR